MLGSATGPDVCKIVVAQDTVPQPLRSSRTSSRVALLQLEIHLASARTSVPSATLMLTSRSEELTPAELSIASVLRRPPAYCVTRSGRAASRPDWRPSPITLTHSCACGDRAPHRWPGRRPQSSVSVRRPERMFRCLRTTEDRLSVFRIARDDLDRRCRLARGYAEQLPAHPAADSDGLPCPVARRRRRPPISGRLIVILPARSGQGEHALPFGMKLVSSASGDRDR